MHDPAQIDKLLSYFQETDLGIALFDSGGAPLFCNEAFLGLCGLTQEQFKERRLENLPGLDRSLLQRLASDRVVKVEHFLETPGAKEQDRGTGFFAELSLQRLSNREAGQGGWTLTLRDISVRRQAEHRLLMLSQAVDQTSNSIVITDTGGRIQFVNSAFCRTSGHAASDIIGKTTRVLKSGLMPPEIYKRMWQKLDKGEVWQGELLNRRKNGDLYWENVSITPIKDPRGLIFQHIAVKEDITERKLNKGRAELQQAVTKILSTEQSLPQAATPLVKAIAQGLSCGWVELWEQDAATGHLVCRGYASAFEHAPREGELPCVGQVLSSAQDPRLQTLRIMGEQRFLLSGLHSARSFAIRSAHRNEGVLVVGDLVRDDGNLSQLLQGFCLQLGEFTQRHRENTELRLLSCVAQSLPGRLMLAELDGRILWANTEMEALTGLLQADLRRLKLAGLPSLTPQQAIRTGLQLTDGAQLSLNLEVELRPLLGSGASQARVLVLVA